MESELPAAKPDGIYIHQLSAHFSPAYIKKAGSYPVRELEQETKGRWLAFVDDNAESHDVQITIEKKKVTAHTCECKEPNENFCKHQLAVLLKIEQQLSGEVSTQKKVARKKSDPVLNLLEQIEGDALKSWVKEILLQQKDLSISFLNRFTINPADYTDEEIQLITDKAVKSIVKNKRRIDQSELKKIVLLLKEVHQPVMEYYLRNITDPAKVSLLSKLLQSIENWHYAFKIKSTKIPAYKAELLAQTIQPLYDIENIKVWQKVIAAYFVEAFKEATSLGTDWQMLLMEIAKLDRRKDRTDYLLATFKATYQSTKALHNGLASTDLTKSIWDLYLGLNRLPDCVTWIAPIYHDNAFNLTLIDALIENGHPEIAEERCVSIIKHNYYEELNEPFMERLMQLYATNPAKRKDLHKLLLHMLPASGTFEDYRILKYEYFSNKPEELKKWQMKILAQLAVLMKDSISSAKFLFAIYNDENKPDKMLDKIAESITIEIAIDYFDKLLKFSKGNFLLALLKFSAFYKSREYNEKFYPALAALVKEHYTNTEILTAFQNTRSYYMGTFAKYLEKKLQV